MPHEHPPPPPPPEKANEEVKLAYVKEVIVGPYSDDEKSKAIKQCYIGDKE